MLHQPKKCFSTLALLSMLCLILSMCEADGSLEMVVALIRHCPREPFRRDGSSMKDFGQPQCIPEFINETTTVGTKFRDNYQKLINSSKYDPDAHLFISSDTDRTLETGQGVLNGIFSDRPMIAPIHATQGDIDFKLRGFDKCGRFQRNLEDFYKSDVFVQKEKETAAFRNQMASKIHISSQLKDWFNVYDRYLLRHVYHVDWAAPAVSNQEFARISGIMDWLERHRYGPDVAGNLPGSGILGEIRSQLLSGAKSLSENRQHPRFILYFAHYPTMFSLLSAMGFDPSSAPLDHVPQYLASISFELRRQSDGNFTIGVVFMDGSADTPTPVPFSNGGSCQDKVDCPLTDFANDTSRNAPSLVDFCGLCENCADFQEITGGTPTTPSPVQGMSPVATWLLAAGVGIVLILIGYFIGFVLGRRNRRSQFTSVG